MVVPAAGPYPCDILLVGEAPGEVEAAAGYPFAGPSGAHQDRYLEMFGLHRRRIRMTNLIPEYIPGNPEPTPAKIREWEHVLIEEIGRTNPRFIISVGAHSTRWFLGDVDMDSVHGLPQRSARVSAPVAVIPCYHPAYGLRDPDADVLVYYDYQQAAATIQGKISSVPVEDEHPEPAYLDGLTVPVDRPGPAIISLDVEGPLDPALRHLYWGFSASFYPGSGAVFRRSHPDFQRGVDLINQVIADLDPLVVLHNLMGLDYEVLNLMGVNISRARVYDTMVAAYHLRVEPQGLKPLARRHCGMNMRTYEEVIGAAAYGKQITYIAQVAATDWGKPEPRVIHEHDGTSRLYKPQPLHVRAGRIIEDCAGDQSADLWGRWRKIDKDIRRDAERVLGSFPWATLDDVPLDSAIAYSGRDPDATLRLYHKLVPMVDLLGLTDRVQLDLDVLPLFEEMQRTGIPASRKRFAHLSSAMWDEMMRIGSHISHTYCDGRPFNPMSAPQVATLARLRGLAGAKRTRTGRISTSKKSMEHLRRVDSAMDQIFTWREHEKVKDSFADPILERIEEAGVAEGTDICPIRCTIRVTRVASGRVSATDPNLTAMPVATKLGRQVREGFVPPGADICLMTGDKSQIEMRIMAHLSRDPLMCQMFHEQRDIHSETAIKVFGLDPSRYWDNDKGEYIYPGVSKMDHRHPTKRTGFGIITGIQGEGLYDQLRMQGVDIDKFCSLMGESDPVRACNLLIAEWFKVYPGVRAYLRQCGQEAGLRGHVREMGGMIRYLPGVYSNHPGIAAEARRQSHSHIISGSAQTDLRLSMRWLAGQVADLRSATGAHIKWLMQIHDELLFSVHESVIEPMKQLLYEALASHGYKLRIPTEAHVAVSYDSWGALDK